MKKNTQAILEINVLLVIFSYVAATNIPDLEIIAFFLWIFQTAANFILAIIFLIIYWVKTVQNQNAQLFSSLSIAFFLSTAIVVLLSFSACFIVL